MAKRSLSKDTLLIQLSVPKDDEWTERIKAKYPGLEIRWEPLRWKPGDGVEQGLFDVSAETWDGVTLACLYLPHSDHLMETLRYVQITSAGVDNWVKTKAYDDPNVTICSSRGVQSPQLAEWVIATFLMMRNGYLGYAATQRQATWSKDISPVQDSSSMRMGILGYGAIGRQCGRLAQALGMEVYAYTRSARMTPEARKDGGYILPNMGDPDGTIPTKWFHGSSQEDVDEFLGQDLDVLVLALPITDETRKIIGPRQFDILSKKKTFVSNVSRGGLIDTNSLVEALETGKIQGAALDVTHPEPLPDGHPLFTAPNVFITPHIGFRTKGHYRNILNLLELNLDRLSLGQPLLNAVRAE